MSSFVVSATVYGKPIERTVDAATPEQAENIFWAEVLTAARTKFSTSVKPGTVKVQVTFSAIVELEVSNPYDDNVIVEEAIAHLESQGFDAPEIIGTRRIVG